MILLCVISTQLPQKSIENNIATSEPLFNPDGDYPSDIIKGAEYQLDNYTDALMLNTAFCTEAKSPINSILLNQALIDEGAYKPMWHHLSYSISNPGKETNFKYARYWMGSMYAYRFPLAIMNYNDLRWFNYILTSLLFVGFIIQLRSVMATPAIVGICSGLIFVNFFVMQFMMQFAPILIITLVGSMMLVSKIKRYKLIWPLFFTLGGLTSFFDLLTVPMLGLCFPLLIWAQVKSQDYDLKSILKQILGFSLTWALGFLLIWTTKWLLVDLFTDFPIYKDVSQKLLERSTSWHWWFTYRGLAGTIAGVYMGAICLVNWTSWKAIFRF